MGSPSAATCSLLTPNHCSQPTTVERRQEQAINLRLGLRSALWPSGDLGRILAALREAESLAEVLDDPRRLAAEATLAQMEKR
jgi:hypothetical protein